MTKNTDLVNYDTNLPVANIVVSALSITAGANVVVNTTAIIS